jgi:hypothetical protein
MRVGSLYYALEEIIAENEREMFFRFHYRLLFIVNKFIYIPTASRLTAPVLIDYE